MSTPAVIFATASVGFLGSAIWADTANSFLAWISPTAPQISTFWSVVAFIVCAGIAIKIK
jgi:hypothetical protein